MNPQRTCIGCRAVDDQGSLIRLVRQGDVVVDATNPRLPGRGAYLHPGCLGVAERRQAVRRAFGPGAELAPSTREAIRPSGSGGPDTL
ncbi:YlxR family protein [Tessaracoccus massiliensis]|uniref:YlxR family protein n=1 Tax=Tessaracoccus massiliensis TaxID=1522311 RepID=UPI0009423A94|nr:YlxR family protein [Tessaracoccus massiliensis]